MLMQGWESEWCGWVGWVPLLELKFQNVNCKNGAYRGPIGQKQLGDFWVFSYIFNVFYGICGVYLFPKLLKKVPGHFGILFR